MRLAMPLLLLSLFFPFASLAQDIRYVSGEQHLPLRGGAGDDYPVVYRGIVPGTRLTVTRTSDDGLWADITTDEGTTGWIPTQNLVLEPSTESTLPESAPILPDAGDPGADNVIEEGVLPTDTAALLNRITSCDAEFNAAAQELHQLKQVSGKAVQLDIDNRRLVEATENLRSEVEMLQAENQRLVDKLESEDFMNGVLAVLLGVIIALVAPRLVPQRRKSSSW